MKTNILNKGKYYIISAIAILLIISMGLSFCAWDSNSLKNISMQRGVADYKPYTLVGDRDNDKTTSVGDIVTFGKYYQDNNQIDKSSIRWIIVDIKIENSKSILYLLSERVMAFGNFCGIGWYYNDDGINISDPKLVKHHPRYDDSTLRAWLNSEDRLVDKGVGFSNPSLDNHVVFKGFYNEAFSSEEKNLIVTRDIGGASGGPLVNDEIVQYDGVKNQKVWTPSVTELYGRIQMYETAGSETFGPFNNDYIGDEQFEYFEQNSASAKIAKCTLFSTTRTDKGLANFSMPGLQHKMNLATRAFDVQQEVPWLTRSPGIYLNGSTMRVNMDGNLYGEYYMSYGNQYGVRPAICLEK